jgi:GNAT superfamily N-acetyltransferase
MPVPLQHYPLLDNPVWNALQTVNKSFALGTDTVKRYPADVLRIMGCADSATANLKEIEPWLLPGEKIFMVGELAPIPDNWTNFVKIDCIQMVCPKPVKISVKSAAEIFPITEKDRPELLALVSLVLPGFFFKYTYQLGNYYGIKQDGKLVAAAGERLKITGLTEVSAVVTHPDYTGKGYAQQLVAHVAAKNFDEGNTPFLHFLATNMRARKVYELAGFEERRVITFWGLQRS